MCDNILVYNLLILLKLTVKIYQKNNQSTKQVFIMTTPTKIYLSDYRPPAFMVDSVELLIQIFDTHTQVTSTLYVSRQTDSDLVLFGRGLELNGIWVNGQAMQDKQYTLDDEQLIIKKDALPVCDDFEVTTVVTIFPDKNTQLEGLYASGKDDGFMYVTQCEAEGFRKITFFPDRPDVLSIYTTRLEADKRFDTLLSNGNLIETGELDDNRHFAVWHDPIKKSSYLFACVIGNLVVLEDSYTTIENRQVLLQLYAPAQDIDKCHVGMQALKGAMKWDEDNYGRAYDLDRYMIVATPQFNMGAMENKGLNIFNTSCVLSHPDTTTDRANFGVKSVIAHEYFHNWTGNRITCRDWFQLCLKEGLTVFRDQSFSADFRSKAVQRIEDVAVLRAVQFTEDASALAHPVRPDNFVEINNFYTATVYEKGAEIVRMIANLLGAQKYRRGMDTYFDRYDGQAVTVEDFVDALASQDKRVLDFLQWYKQPATPVLSGSYEYNDTSVTVHLSQRIRQVAGYDIPKNLPIPVQMAIFDSQTGKLLDERLVILQDAQNSFVIDCSLNGTKPLVSVLRGFSAPVELDFEYSDDELLALVKFETDGFNRWQALQMLVNRYLLDGLDNADKIIAALRLAVEQLIGNDNELCARLFDIPSEKQLAFFVSENYDPVLIKQRRDTLKNTIAKSLSDKLYDWYAKLPLTAYEDTPKADGERALRNVLLSMTSLDDKDTAQQLAKNQYDNGTCMTEKYGALSAMVLGNLSCKDEYLQKFYDQYRHEDLVIDNWFNLQAYCDTTDVLAIDKLLSHRDFDWQVPNRVRSVMSAILLRPTLFWDTQDGLPLVVDILLKLDEINPQISARLAGGLAGWHTLKHAQTVKPILQKLNQAKSKNLTEVIQKILDAKKSSD